MTPRAALVQIGKFVAKDMARGQVSQGMRAVSELLEAYPTLTLELVELMVGENAKKKPNNNLITAYGFMLGQALELLRYAIERSRPEASELVQAIERRLLSLGEASKLEPALLLIILTQYSAAKLAPGEALRSLMGGLVDQAAMGSSAEPSTEEFGSHFANLVKQTGGDAFAIHGDLAETSHALPEQHRAAMAVSALQAEQPAVREAGIGWVLDESAAVRNIVAHSITQMASSGTISAVMLRRLIVMRNWLPEANREAIDTAIKTCRKMSVACASMPTLQIRDVTASGIDGAGCQSFFVVVKEGRKHAIASLLVKHGVGVRDAWVQRGMSLAEAEGFMGNIAYEIDLYESSADHLSMALSHFLASSLAGNRMPPFDLIDFVETVGLTAINPKPISVETLLGSLLDAIPTAKKKPTSVNKAIKGSARWVANYGFVDHWFEDDDDVSQLLTAKRLSKKARVDLILDSLLPCRRQRWIEMLTWSALSLHQEDDNDDWSDFALVANELVGERPLRDFPIMHWIALSTVEAWIGRGG